MARRQLRNQVAIVTGASSGVGWQSAVRLAEQGVKVCVTARRPEALEKLVREIGSRGGEALSIPADSTDDDAVRAVVAGCLERFGRLDILVNNAAVQAYDYFDRLPWEDVQRTFDVNCFGYFRFARAVLPHFRTHDRGHIVNVLSMLSVGAAPLLSVYTASKHALLGWSDSMRLELYQTGIDVSAILLPSVSTPMFAHAPMRLGVAPRPVPPTYDTDVAARAVLHCARKPNKRYVPVFLQGTAMLWMQQYAPWFGDVVMGRFGARLQMGNRPVDPAKGSLHHPIPEGVGPYGPVPPTPAWKRWGVVAAGVAATALMAGGLAAGTARAARALP